MSTNCEQCNHSHLDGKADGIVDHWAIAVTRPLNAQAYMHSAMKGMHSK